MNFKFTIFILALLIGAVFTRIQAAEPATSPAPAAAPISAAVASSHESPEVGEPVTLRIEIAYTPGETRLLNVKWEDGGFERMPGIPAPATASLPDGHQQYTQNIPARTWEIEKAAFGPVTIEYEHNGQRGELTLDKVEFPIKSLLAGDDAAIGAMRTPMLVPPPPYALYVMLAGGALAILLLLLAIILWLRHRSGRVQAPAPQPLGPPDLEALQAIDALVDSDLLERGELKEFFTRLGDIVREYLFRRFGILAHELTTFEIMLAVDGAPTLANAPDSHGLRAMLEGAFIACDLVKFAKHRPDAKRIEQTVDMAREFIVLTRPRPALEPAGSTNAALAGSA